MGKGGGNRHLVVIFLTCLKYAKKRWGGKGGGEVVDISHNVFWLHNGSNYKIFIFGLRM